MGAFWQSRTRGAVLSCVLVLAAAWSGGAESNHVPEMTLAQKVAASDVVAIARVLAVDEGPCMEMSRCARLGVSTTLKGKPSSEMVVLFDGPVAEFDPPCCEVGRAY